MTTKQLHACEKLSGLAEKPFDLTQGLQKERVSRFTLEAAGWTLSYATEKVTDEVITQLVELASEVNAVEKMERMQKGDVMNPFENRSVLHTAVRDLFETAKNPEGTNLAKKEIEKLKVFVKDTTYTDLVMIAIGGSELGPEAVYLALQPLLKAGRNVHFISNIDPDNMTAVMMGKNLSKTLVLVVSKSGTTLETQTNEAFARSFFEKQGLDSNRHFIAVTMPKTPMDDKSRYKEVFYIWDWIGGRYSTTSMVGGVMMGWAFGVEAYLEFLKGAHAMDMAALQKDPQKNLPLMMALLGVWNRNFLGYPTLAIIPYSHGLRRFAAHLQQVDMESSGKRVNLQKMAKDKPHQKTGPIVWGEPGTSAQHSFFQLLHQGTDIVPVEMIGFKECEWGKDFSDGGTTSQQKLLSNLFAQAIALAQGKKSTDPNKEFPGNRPSRILLAKKLTPYSLGALFALYEHKIAFQGFIWNINSFDQEGVQLGKVLANKMIDLFCGKGDSYPLGEAYLNELKRL
jgi:glucose-6-phosphate isomerase